MSPPPIPTWKERLAACFRWRHRLMHVFGVPGALGAVTAVAAASALNPDVGLALGTLAAGLGTVLAGYYVTAGFDKSLVTQLQKEHVAGAQRAAEGEIQQALVEAEPELRPMLERILHYHANVEGVFAGGNLDQVEAILQSSRGDLLALRDRAVAMVSLHRRLTDIIRQTDGRWHGQELQRMSAELEHSRPGPVRDAIEAARASTERTLAQWRAAIDKQHQIRSMLTVIESNLQEFKLAMELRKAEAAMGSGAASPDISELQARLAAAGDACDELVGRNTGGQRRARRAIA